MLNANNWIVWGARKLASQDFGYLPRRSFATVQKYCIDRSFPTAWMARRAELTFAEPLPSTTLREKFYLRSLPRWHWILDHCTSIAETISRDRQAGTIALAEEIALRRFTFRGQSPRTLALGNWSPSGVSRGWTWDLNRHHWFATLAFAYWYSGDLRFLQSFVEQSSDWMNQHLGRLGRISWDGPFEIASRINAWIWAHFLFVPSSDWPSAHHERFLRALGLQAEYLSQTMEYHCPGNHILLEAKALVLVGESFPEFRGSSEWRQKGWNILDRELEKQICDDGVHAERSTMYHRIVAGELAELWHFCQRNDHSRASELGEIVRKMADFQRWIDQGRGDLPLFGDAHREDTYCRLSAPAISDPCSNTISRNRMAEPTDHTSWLRGGCTNAAVHRQPRDEVPAGRAFLEGGYFVTRSDWSENADVLVWDCGPAGYACNRRHAHLDTLSFTLSVAGTPLLIDPGVHEADNQKKLRSTRVHSTVCIDREDQGIPTRRSEIWLPPRAELLLWATSNECTVMSGRHDGYLRLKESVQVARTIVAMHGLYWLIVDSVEGLGQHLVEQRFHIVPGSCVALRDGGARLEVSRGSAMLFFDWALRIERRQETTSTSQLQLRIEPSLSEMYCGLLEQSWMISAEHFGQVPLEIAAVFSSQFRDVRVRWLGGNDCPFWLVVTGLNFEHYILADRAAGRAVVALPSAWATDAQFAIIRRSSGLRTSDALLPSQSKVWQLSPEQDRVDRDRMGPGGLRRIELDNSRVVDWLRLMI